MEVCDRCDMENCVHTAGLEWDVEVGSPLTDDEAGTGPEIDAHHPGECANCGTHFEAETRIKHVLFLEHGKESGGWVAPCCYAPLGEPR